jgi:hypothetical protein
MMDGLDDLPAAQAAQLQAGIAKLKANRQGIIVGRNHLSATNKRIGERFKLTGSGAINWGLGGISFPIAFFDRFMIPLAALWWGPAIGGLAALLGSSFPAWSACTVRVADVFSGVTFGDRELAGRGPTGRPAVGQPRDVLGRQPADS